MIPDDHDEVDINDFDPENDRQSHRFVSKSAGERV